MNIEYFNNFFIDKENESIYEEDIVKDKVILSRRKLSSPITSPLSLINECDNNDTDDSNIYRLVSSSRRSKMLTPMSSPIQKIDNNDDRNIYRLVSSSSIQQIDDDTDDIDINDRNIYRLASLPACSPTVQLVSYKKLMKKYVTDKLVSKNYLVKKNRSLSYESILNFYNKIPKNKRWFYNQKIVSKNEHIK